ncbi:MAG: hypothetical protein CMQ05_02185 [Gammaproteobacteria bacterium]|uniref:Exo-alpha-sialidase n=1 Tax=OM182 bacterium MED-G24 TaxID=1986255 RepID=A0A2A5WZF2_9GAMM|nr:hypothetical protein [Gammaproteobacteria bacterium]PDH41653.1 MAG: hypothetical protein CNE99_01100 [OM182 bacterium MED-G24]RPG26680.1 MAG: hypothetical protein CBC10_003945 [Gammaproteobacteria bacterium TMED50]|tara:strand:+ start:9660 stop:10640 length:981 start_codon:yes stop_codon:yes gene_type:complete
MILAGTSKGVFRVTDDGCECTLESGGVREVVSINGRLFAGTSKGLFTSDDEGHQWALRGLEDQAVWQVRDNGEGALYAGTAPTGLYRSTNSGDSWEPVLTLAKLAEDNGWCIPLDPPIPASARALVVQGDNLCVGVEVGGIAMSDDAGQSWRVVLPGNNPDIHMMFADPRTPGVIYTSTGYGRLDGVAEMVEGNAGVFRSDDGGLNWQYAWKGMTPRYSRPMCIDHRAPFGLTVASAPTAFSNFKQPDGSGAMLFRSEDGGESWHSLCDDVHSPSRANFHGLTVDPDNPGGVIVGTDSGELWRVSNDREWQTIASGLPAILSIAAG